MKKKNIKIINFQKKEEYSYKRKVIITDLVFNTLIGIHDFEKEKKQQIKFNIEIDICLLYTSPSPRDHPRSRMPSSA